MTKSFSVVRRISDETGSAILHSIISISPIDQDPVGPSLRRRTEVKGVSSLMSPTNPTRKEATARGVYHSVYEYAENYFVHLHH